MLAFLAGRKTYLVCIVTVAYALVQGWQSGDWQGEIPMILAALGAAGLRSGISAGK